MQLDKLGTLLVRTYTAGDAYPVENAIVRVRGAMEENAFIEYSFLTDRDGMTEKISLPTTSLEYSQSPNPPEQPYALYDVEVIKEGYYPKRIYNIAIFENNSTTLPVNMIPLEDGVSYPQDTLESYLFENPNLE